MGAAGRVWDEVKAAGELGWGGAAGSSGDAPGFTCPEAALLQTDSQAKDTELVCQLSFLSSLRAP